MKKQTPGEVQPVHKQPHRAVEPAQERCCSQNWVFSQGLSSLLCGQLPHAGPSHIRKSKGTKAPLLCRVGADILGPVHRQLCDLGLATLLPCAQIPFSVRWWAQAPSPQGRVTPGAQEALSPVSYA